MAQGTIPTNGRGGGRPEGRGGSGPTFVNNSNGSGPATEPADEEEVKPKTFAERMAKVRKDVQTTWAGIPRAFSLVWQSSKGLTVGMAVLAVISGFVPTLTAWISKLLIDNVVAAAKSGGVGTACKR